MPASPRIDVRRTHRLGMAAVLGLEGYVRHRLPRRLAELVKLRASHLNGCESCIDMHTKALAEDGETLTRIAALAETPHLHMPFNRAENAALTLTDHLTRIDPDVGVSDEVWADAAAHFSEAELGDLVFAIATINVWNRINIAARLEA